MDLDECAVSRPLDSGEGQFENFEKFDIKDKMHTMQKLLGVKAKRNNAQLGQAVLPIGNFKTVVERSQTRCDIAHPTELSKGGLHLKLDQVNRSVNVSMSARTRVVHSSIDEHYNQLHNYAAETKQVNTISEREIEKRRQSTR